MRMERRDIDGKMLREYEGEMVEVTLVRNSELCLAWSSSTCHGSDFFAPSFTTTKDSFLCFPYLLFTSELFSLSYQPGQSGLFY